MLLLMALAENMECLFTWKWKSGLYLSVKILEMHLAYSYTKVMTKLV